MDFLSDLTSGNRGFYCYVYCVELSVQVWNVLIYVFLQTQLFQLFWSLGGENDTDEEWE